MSATIEVLSGLQRRVKISVPKEEMVKDYEKRLQDYSKGVKLKGFRPGKVPKNMLEQRYGKSIRREVRDEMVRKNLSKALEENNLSIVGMPEMDPPEWTVGEAYDFEVEFEVYPEVELGSLEELEATRYQVEITEEDISEMILSLAEQRKQWSEVDRAAADGDQVTIDFTGTLNGENFEGGSATDFVIEIGSKRMIPGFEEGLVGIEKGVSRELRLVFPEDYGSKELAGQSVEFAVTAKVVSEPKLPEIDDAFAKEIGFADLAALKEMVSSRLEKEALNALRNSQKENILDQLLDKHPIDLPKRLVDAELDYLQAAAKQQGEAQKQQAAAQGTADDGEEKGEEEFDRDEYLEQASRRVRLGLLLSAVVKHFDIKLNQVEVRQRVEQIAMNYPNPQELVEWLYKDRSRLAEIETAVLEDQAIEVMLESLKQEPTAISYQSAVEKVRSAQKDAEQLDQE